MTDKELLELAAKAADLKPNSWRWYEAPSKGFYRICDEGFPTMQKWNPLTDDGDALRLAVKLGFAIRVLEKCVFVESDPETLLAFSQISQLEMFSGDPYAATRRAIVRAAAEVGSGMRPFPSVEEIKQWVGQDD